MVDDRGGESQMYLTQSNVIRGLSKQEYTMLREMCQYSNNLYNVAVYTIRQHYFDTHQFLRYEENYPICYLQDPEPAKTSPDRVLAIDLGLDNLAACVTNTGTSFLMDGRKLKSINQYWNKRKARLQSIAAKQGWKTTNQLCQLAKKRHFRMQDILRKTARYILDFCISHQIGTIVCGYNRDFKRELKLGKVTNQHFTQINLSYLRSTLKHLCERYGITYLEQEESYTSQASCLDLDDIPVYQPNAPYTGTFSGKRVRRGLYRFANGRTANADINGAANILRKSKQNFDFEGLCKGLLDSPLRIRLS